MTLPTHVWRTQHTLMHCTSLPCLPLCRTVAQTWHVNTGTVLPQPAASVACPPAAATAPAVCTVPAAPAAVHRTATAVQAVPGLHLPGSCCRRRLCGKAGMCVGALTRGTECDSAAGGTCRRQPPIAEAARQEPMHHQCDSVACCGRHMLAAGQAGA